MQLLPCCAAAEMTHIKIFFFTEIKDFANNNNEKYNDIRAIC